MTYSGFLSFWHSSLYIFKGTGSRLSRQQWTLKIFSVVMWNSVLLHFAFLKTAFFNPLIGVGIAISLMALLVYWVAVFSLRGSRFSVIYGEPSDSVHQRGIYRYVRHPFYTAHITSYIGVALTMPNLWHLFLALVLIGLYRLAAISEEQSFLKSPQKQAYARYMDSTGRFFPKIY